MKKLVLVAVLLAVLCFAGSGQAADLRWDLAASGDVVYDFGAREFLYGGGLTLVTYKETLELRGAVCTPADDSKFSLNIGLGLRIVPALQKLGMTWVPSALTPSIGFGALYTPSDNRVAASVYVSVIRVAF